MTNTGNAEIAQLVEHNLAKVGVSFSALFKDDRQAVLFRYPRTPPAKSLYNAVLHKLVHCMIARKKN